MHTVLHLRLASQLETSINDIKQLWGEFSNLTKQSAITDADIAPLLARGQDLVTCCSKFGK